MKTSADHYQSHVSDMQNDQEDLQNELNQLAAAGYYFTQVQQDASEKVSGFPQPDLYNQHYINRYAFPRGLISVHKPEITKKSPYKKSIYEVNVNPIRKGVSGWKLTKKIPDVGPQFTGQI
jgi:hypothetical protein